MGKLLSERERKLQRKLIPLNIFVCILALTAVFSIIFAPFVKIDFGKFLSDDATIALVEETIEKAVDEGVENGEAGSTGVDYMPAVIKIISSVFKNAEGTITISGYEASKIAFSGDNKGDKVLEEFFFGDEALVMKLVDSIADGVSELFKSPEGKELIADVVVESIANSLVEKLANETAAKNLTGEEITNLTGILKDLENAQGDEGVDEVADKFVAQLKKDLGNDFNEETDGDVVRNYVKEMYNDTSDKNEGTYSFEAMISITISQNVNLKDYNIGGMFGNSDGEKPSEGSALKRAVDGEVQGDEAEEPVTPPTSEEGEGEEPVTPPAGEEGEGEEPVTPPTGEEGEGETPVTPPTGGNETEDGNVICTSYSEILEQLGLGDEDIDELKGNLKTALHEMVDGYVSDYSDYMGYYQYVFYSMLGLAAPWLILFLFSFFHMLAKNKRFMMWYVKLFGFIPTIVSTVIFALQYVVKHKYDLIVNNLNLSENAAGLVKALIGSLSSLMWIVTICYTLLWLVSIFWAFPIKHKIRKERKLVKQYGASNDYSGSGKKNKKEKKKKGKSSGYSGTQSSYGYNDDYYDDGGFNAPYYGDDYYDYK